jgi:hypothetical protein
MKSDIGFLKRRAYSLGRTVENLNRNRNAFEECEEISGELRIIFDRILKCLGEVNAIRTAIEDKINELEAAS